MKEVEGEINVGGTATKGVKGGRKGISNIGKVGVKRHCKKSSGVNTIIV
jgi:hypothetical protein